MGFLGMPASQCPASSVLSQVGAVLVSIQLYFASSALSLRSEAPRASAQPHLTPSGSPACEYCKVLLAL